VLRTTHAAPHESRGARLFLMLLVVACESGDVNLFPNFQPAPVENEKLTAMLAAGRIFSGRGRHWLP